MKNYTIVLKDTSDSESFISDMNTVSATANVPSRQCNVTPVSGTRCFVGEMTKEEADKLLLDPRVKEVQMKRPFKVVPMGVPSSIEKKFEVGMKREYFGKHFILKPYFEIKSNTKEEEVTIQSYDNLASISGLPGGSGVDVVIVDGVINANNPEMKNGGGASRLKNVNWLAGSGSYSYSVDVSSEADNHGQHVAGTACGRLQGWAKESDIYNIYPYDSGLVGYLVGLKSWHEGKTNGNPTVSNHSYGFLSDDTTDIRYVLSVTIEGTKILPNRNDSGAVATCSVGGGGLISGFSMAAGGSNYTNAPDVSFYGGGRDSAIARMANNSVYIIHVTNRGSGYDSASPPAVTFGSPPSGGVAATGRCIVSGGKISEIIMTNRGRGYTSAPSITFGPPMAGGSQATGTTTIGSNFILEINISNGGSGHTENFPSIVISGGGCSVDSTWVIDDNLASLTESTGVLQNGLYKIYEEMSDLSSTEFKQTPMGGYYLSTPTVSFLYRKGTVDGPYATATVSGSSVTAITAENSGYSYDFPPQVVITNGGGFSRTQLMDWGVGGIVESQGHYYLVDIPLREASVDSIMEDLIDSGVVVVSAAGNTNSRVSSQGDAGYDDVFEYLTYTHAKFNPAVPEQPNSVAAEEETVEFAKGSSPSAADGVICVGSMRDGCCPETKSSFSNAGSRVDLYAAGGNVMSSVHSNSVAGEPEGAVPHPLDGSYWMNKYSGTSMASPQVAGAVACYAETNRSIDQSDARAWLSTNATSGLVDGTAPYSLFGGQDKILYYPGLTVQHQA